MVDTMKKVGLPLGPVLFLLICMLPLPEGMTRPALYCAATTVLMAVWWISEAIPIPATSMVPIVLFPLLQIMPTSKATLPYANHLIYLFMGGFFIAVCMERWNLHYRIAMHTIRIVGTSPSRIVLGFMVAAGFLSMWVSNTATTVMMMPIGLAIIKACADITGDHDLQHNPFAVSLMLALAYAASIGGLATIIGTPPNTIMVAQLDKLYHQTISFLDWMKVGVPLAATFLIITWLLLTKVLYRVKGDILQGRGEALIQAELDKLGPMKKEEKLIVCVFAVVATLWIVMGLVKWPIFKGVSDASVAIFGALMLFVIPSDLKRGVFLLDWKTAVKIPWDVILLFGGGLCLADGFQDTGLTKYIAGLLVDLEGMQLVWIIACIVALNIFLTEVTSNTAVATLMIPVMGAIAVGMKINPLGPIVAACIACSYAFMLPVATPPNAVVFGSGAVTIRQMAKTGFWLNILGIIQITLVVYFLMPWVWGVDLTTLPSWAVPK
ncbi:SLC13 family permease [Solidesulfovibrio sp.]|uniref:SLC13 family permease n=1 Tax=Solidesulfovibrio sp. TaxID=2910990 RepID=UPI000EC291B6|nr:SLC13 family permease [Solidesulfovibrio sp.]MEA5089043.1 SLC13 family permease [Solidesulfovibrio sp.]HCR13911.1 anion transporter [Desulfovibrio sp.]HML62617.1 SLC13 family permease [Solidesulfovibrio sp.]